MDCKEFREKISAGNDFDKDLIEHKEKCSECQKWIAKELSTAPTGVSEETWNKAVSKCFSDDANTNDNKKNINKPEIKINSDENKSFMDYYLSGLKYGIVFGLSLVVGFAIIQNKNEENKNLKTISNESLLASDTLKLATDSANLPIASECEIILLPGQ